VSTLQKLGELQDLRGKNITCDRYRPSFSYKFKIQASVFCPPRSGSVIMVQEPGYGSGSFLSTSKISKNNLDFYYLVPFFDFLSLKTDAIVLLKDYKQKSSEKNSTKKHYSDKVPSFLILNRSFGAGWF
jgi:hypothetical protein